MSDSAFVRGAKFVDEIGDTALKFPGNVTAVVELIPQSGKLGLHFPQAVVRPPHLLEVADFNPDPLPYSDAVFSNEESYRFLDGVYRNAVVGGEGSVRRKACARWVDAGVDLPAKLIGHADGCVAMTHGRRRFSHAAESSRCSNTGLDRATPACLLLQYTEVCSDTKPSSGGSRCGLRVGTAGAPHNDRHGFGGSQVINGYSGGIGGRGRRGVGREGGVREHRWGVVVRPAGAGRARWLSRVAGSAGVAGASGGPDLRLVPGTQAVSGRGASTPDIASVGRAGRDDRPGSHRPDSAAEEGRWGRPGAAGGVVRLRIAGTPAECAATVAALGRVTELLDVSRPLPLHRDPARVRVHVTVRLGSGPVPGEGRCA